MKHFIEIALLSLICLGVIYSFLRQDAHKTTTQQLQRLSDDFKVRHNVRIRTEATEKIVIEHIAVSKAGLFIINVENRNGKIIGEEPEEMWTEESKNESEQFPNPTFDNLKVIRSLRKYINDSHSSVPIYHVVVFGKKADLNEVICESAVLRCNTLSSYINRFTEEKISSLEVEAIYSKL